MPSRRGSLVGAGRVGSATAAAAVIVACLGLSCVGRLVPPPQRELGRTLARADEARYAEQMAWSHTGRYLALNFVRGDPDLPIYWIAVIDAKTGRRVTGSAGPKDVLPVWAPDDRFLYYSRMGQLVRLSVPGGEGPELVLPLRGVFPSGLCGAAGAWLSEKELLTTIGRRGPGDPRSRIAAINVSNGQVRDIAPRQEGYRVPIASQSRRMVAWAGGEGEQEELVVAGASTMDQPSVIKGSHGLQDYAWAPDGRWIAYTRKRDGGYELCRLDLPSHKPTSIAQHRAFGGPISVSATGLVALEAGEGQKSRIRIYDLRNGRYIAASPSGVDCGRPAWSPDGRQLAYATYSKRGLVVIRVIGLDQILGKWPDNRGARVR